MKYLLILIATLSFNASAWTLSDIGFDDVTKGATSLLSNTMELTIDVVTLGSLSESVKANEKKRAEAKKYGLTVTQYELVEDCVARNGEEEFLKLAGNKDGKGIYKACKAQNAEQVMPYMGYGKTSYVSSGGTVFVKAHMRGSKHVEAYTRKARSY